MKRFKPALKIKIIICFILTGLIFMSSLYIIPLTDRNTLVNIDDLLKEKENTIDVLSIGNRKLSYGINPMDMYHKFGIRSYNAISGSSYRTQYYDLLAYSLKKQKPKAVIVETSALFDYDNSFPTRFSNLQRVISNQFSKSKYDSLDNTKGYQITLNNSSMTQTDYMTSNQLSYQINKENLSDLDKMISYANKNNIKVLFVSLPNIIGWNNNRYKAVKSLADQYKVSYLDFNQNEYRTQIKMNYQYDFYSKNLLNILGSYKVSSYLAYYLSKTYKLDNYKNKSETWKKYYQNYLKILARMTKEEITEVYEKYRALLIPSSKNTSSSNKINRASAPTSYYHEISKSIDVFHIGNSDIYSAINPMWMYQKKGITSYVFGEALQDVSMAYGLFKEALKTQKPKVLVFDTNEIFYQIISSERAKTKSLDYTRRIPSHYNNAKGYFIRYDSSAVAHNTRSSNLKSSSVSNMAEYYLDGIMNLAAKNNIKVLFVTVPCPGDWNVKRREVVKRYAKKYNVNYIDFNEDSYIKKLAIDYSKDFVNANHLNIIGAYKITDYLSDYLANNFGLQNRKSEVFAHQWTLSMTRFQNALKSGATTSTAHLRTYNNLLKVMKNQ